MTLYPTVWPLPYGTTIKTDYSPEHNYELPRSQTQCWEIKLDTWEQVHITSVHNGFLGNQSHTIRAWLSEDPSGTNVIPPLTTITGNVKLGGIGNTWTFYRRGLDKNLITPADCVFAIDPGVLYYFNFQNLENKDNSYFVRFTFSNGIIILEL
jgi:hypothetical protein